VPRTVVFAEVQNRDSDQGQCCHAWRTGTLTAIAASPRVRLPSLASGSRALCAHAASPLIHS